MTLIQPNKQSFFLNSILFILIGLVALGVIWLIFLYNQTVILTHGALSARETAKKIETDNSELKGRMLALFDPGRMAAAAAERGMVVDRVAEYSPITSEWVVASHR